MVGSRIKSPPLLETPQRAAFVQLTAAFLAVPDAPGASRSWLAPPPLEGHQREAGHTTDGHAQDADQLQCVFHDSADKPSRRPARPTSASDPTARLSRHAPLWGR